MKELTMKRLLLIITMLLGIPCIKASISPYPVQIKGPSLMQAVEDSNARSLKQQLILKQELPRNEKEYLIKRAREIAQERRRNVSLFRSPWDLGRFLIGAFLTFNFAFDFDTLGNAEALGKAKQQLKDMKTPAKQFNVPEGSNIVDVLDTKHRLTKDDRALLKKQEKAGTISVPDKQRLDAYKADVTAYKEYDAKYNDLDNDHTILSMRNFLDKSVLGFLGIYWLIRGYFCVTATQSFMQAQRVIEILERVPVVEDREQA